MFDLLATQCDFEDVTDYIWKSFTTLTLINTMRCGTIYSTQWHCSTEMKLDLFRSTRLHMTNYVFILVNTPLTSVCQILSWSSFDCISAWDGVSKVAPLLQVYQAQSYGRNVTLLAWFSAKVANFSMSPVVEMFRIASSAGAVKNGQHARMSQLCWHRC